MTRDDKRHSQPRAARMRGKSPGTGTTLFAAGDRAVTALVRAEAFGLGAVMRRIAT